MNKLKRIITMLSVFIFLVNTFVSCGSDNENTNNKIEVENIYKGTGKFDRDTIYISALNVDDINNSSLIKKDTLNFGIKSLSKQSFNPYFVDEDSEFYIIDAIWEPLMKKGYDGEFYPNILKTLPTVSEDRTTYLFSLREDLTWEDGTRLTTRDIDFTYKFLMDKIYNGFFQREILNIKNWVDYRDGIVNYVPGVEIIDDFNFRVVVETPNDYTMELLNIYPLSFIHYGRYYYLGVEESMKDKDIKPFGNGAFKFLGYEKDNYLILESNNFYFKGRVDIKNITYNVVNPENFINELSSGNIDIARDVFVNKDNILGASKVSFLSGYIFPNYDYVYIGINHLNPFLKDINIRKAIDFSINKQEIVKQISDNNLIPLDFPIDKRFYNLFYDKNDDFSNDNKENPSTLIEGSGWIKGNDGFYRKDDQELELRLLAQKDDIGVLKSLPIIQRYLQNIGIKVNVQEITSQDLKNSIGRQELSNEWDLYICNSQINSKNNLYIDFLTEQRGNTYFYSNFDLDTVLYNLFVEFDVDRLEDLYKQAYQIIRQDVPIIPLYQNKKFDLYNGRILGINSVNIFRTFNYDEIILRK